MPITPDCGGSGRRISVMSSRSQAHMRTGSKVRVSHELTFRELAEQMIRAHNTEVEMLRRQIDELTTNMVRKSGVGNSAVENLPDLSPTASCATVGATFGGRGPATASHGREPPDLLDAGVARFPQDGGTEGPAFVVGEPNEDCAGMKPDTVQECSRTGAASSNENVVLNDFQSHPGGPSDALDVVPAMPRRRVSYGSRRSSSHASHSSPRRESVASRTSHNSVDSSLRSLTMPRSLLKIMSPIEKWCLLVDRLLRDPWQPDRSCRLGDTTIAWELLPLWIRTNPFVTARDRNFSQRSPSRVMAGLSGRDQVSGMKSLRVGEACVEPSCLQDMVMMPNRPKHVAWVVIGAFLILFDAVTIPTMVFEDKAYEMVLLYISCGTALYWVLDMVMNCFVGVHHPDGWIEMRPKQIRAHYFKKRAWRDLIIILIDALAIIIQAVFPDWTLSAQGQNWRINRAIPLLRLVRLLRMGRVRSVVQMLLLRIQTDYVLLMNVCELILVLLMLNHFIACMWYSLAKFNPGLEQRTWIDDFTISDLPKQRTYYYFLAYHWSLTQFSPATNNIAPQNLQERIFAAMIVTFALIVFSSFLGHLNGMLTQVRLAGGQRAKVESRIRDYVDTHKISTQLSTRVRQFFRQNYQQGRALLHEEDIEFFRQMPDSLKASLHYEIYMPCVRAGSVLYWFDDDDPHLLPELCHKAMSEASFFPGQDIFTEDTPADLAYAVSSGRLIYEDMSDQRWRIDPGGEMVWVAELVLFTRWRHLGILSAGVTSEVVTLNAGVTHQILLRGTPAFEKLRKFAIFVVGHYEANCEDGGDEPSDLPLDMNVQEDMYSRVIKLDDMKNTDIIGRVSQQFESMSNLGTRGPLPKDFGRAITPRSAEKLRKAFNTVKVPVWSSWSSTRRSSKFSI